MTINYHFESVNVLIRNLSDNTDKKKNVFTVFQKIQTVFRFQLEHFYSVSILPLDVTLSVEFNLEWYYDHSNWRLVSYLPLRILLSN